MKHKYFILIFMIAFASLLCAQRDWRLYTNTTHIRELLFFDESLVMSTWGGLDFFDIRTNSFTKTITSFDGLSGNNARALAIFRENELMIGINNEGIDRLKNGRLDISLTVDLGLASVRTNVIYTHGDLIFIGSDNGLTLFENEPNFPFPLFKNTYNSEKGLPFRIVNSIIVDDKKQLYVGTNIGFSKVHLDSLHFNPAWKHYQTHSVNSIDYRNQRLALGTELGLIYFDINDIDAENSWVRLFENAPITSVKIKPNTSAIYAVLGSWIDNANSFEPDSLLRSVAIIRSAGDYDMLYSGNSGIFQRPATNIFFYDDMVFVSTWGEGIYLFDERFSEEITDKLNWHNFKKNGIHTNTIVDIVSENNKFWVLDGIQREAATSGAGTGVSWFNNTNDSWTHYNVRNSGIISDNIRAMGIDSEGKKWFGAWWTEPPGANGSWNGLSVLDDSDPNDLKWRRITESSHNIINPTIYSLVNIDNRMWAVSATDNVNTGGVNIFNNDTSLYHTFLDESKNRYTNMHKIDGFLFLGTESSGVSIWNSNSIPNANGVFTQSGALRTGYLYFMDSFALGQNFTQVWFACSNGVVWAEVKGDMVSWYRATSAYKRERFDGMRWGDPQLYFVGEERIFGADSAAVPTAVTIDDIGRVWIGSSNRGITMYNIFEDRFTNFTTSNSPLHTNDITALEYQSSTGLLLIGTKEGMLTTEVGKSPKTEQELGNIAVYPNPFRPDIDSSINIRVVDKALPVGNNQCRIFDVSGQLIKVLDERIDLNGFTWDGTNNNHRAVSSGIYFFLIQTDVGDFARGRIVLIR